MPQQPRLKDPSQWRLIGTKVPRLDSGAKTDGSAVYSMDIRRPGQVTADGVDQVRCDTRLLQEPRQPIGVRVAEPERLPHADTVIRPNTFLEGATKIGAGCDIGPSSRVVDWLQSIRGCFFDNSTEWN